MRWWPLLLLVVGCTDARAPATTVIEERDDVPELDEACLTPVSCELSCQAGDRDHCTKLAVMLDEMLGVPRDGARSRKLLEDACAAEHATACGVLATRIARNGAPAGDVLALAERACHLGSVEGCSRAMRMWALGLGTRPDQASARARRRHALDLAMASCAGGATSGCIELVVDGDLRAPDRPRKDALAALGTACKRADPHACDALVSVHRGDHGDPENEGLEGISWRRLQVLHSKRCERGDVMSCASLVGCPSWPRMVSFNNALIGPGDHERACAQRIGCGCEQAHSLKAQTIGCELGVPASCLRLAEHFYEQPKRSAGLRGRAHELQATACEEGSAWNCHAIAGDDAALRTRHVELLYAQCLSSADGTCTEVAVKLLEGYAGEKDRTRALRAAELACAPDASCSLIDLIKVSAPR